MSTAEKRGLTVKESSPKKADPHVDIPAGYISFPSDSKGSRPLRLRMWRGSCEEWSSRTYILALVSLLSIFALSGSFLFAYSLKTSQEPEFYSKLSLSDNDAWPFKSAWELSTSTERSNISVTSGCTLESAKLKLFMYDLPPEFHYGMLVEGGYRNGQIWPRNVTDIPPYPGGLYQQHSPEYWLTSDLLTSNMKSRQAPCTAFRVSDWREADMIFVPFFASLAYNKYTKSERKRGGGGVAELQLVGDTNQKLQEKLLAFLREQPAWRASGGADHILVIHHPNSMHAMREAFRNVMYLVADFGRYAPEVANIKKDVVAPYKHVIPTFEGDVASFEKRKTLLFFQGTIVRKQGGVIRQKLYEMLKNEEDVRFGEGSSGWAGIHTATEGMRGSKFCLNIAGDTPSSNRLFDAIASHCVPVIISDDIELPFEDELDYSGFSIFIRASDALENKFVINLLRSVTSEEWAALLRRLKAVARHFEYQHPTRPYDAVNMLWRAVARRVPGIRLSLHKEKHFARSRQSLGF